MPFVYKQFTEADQPKYDSCKIKNYLRTFTYPYDWAVDEERDAWFVLFGGQGDVPKERGAPPTFYVLAWKSQLIYFEGWEKPVGAVELESGEIRWEWEYMLDLMVPLSLKEKENLIKEMIYEAMCEYCQNCRCPSYTQPLIFLNTFFVAG